jgi:hypothetical protein
MSNYKIAIKRLALVDSAGFSFVEMPLDEHAILLAVGNVGKSSILNSLRLFLLPEENLRKSEVKFGFRNPKTEGYYTNSQSYDHYFPSNHSFLVLEVENAVGTHCQILYRGDIGSLSYKRIFVPVPFADLRDIFWDTADPDGIGFARSDLSANRVITRAKEISGKTLLASDKKAITNAIYSNDLLSKDHSRYAVLPMPSVDKQKVETLRTLIRMLFEVGGNDRSMGLAVANIIESQKNYERDRFDFDIEHFLSDRESLDQTEKSLVKVKSERPLFDTLAEKFKEYNPRLLMDNFDLWYRSLESAIEGTNEGIRTLSSEVSDLSKAKTEADKESRQAGKLFHQIVGVVKNDTRKKELVEKYIFDGKQLMEGYPGGVTLAEAKDAIDDEKKRLEQELEGLQDDKKQADTKIRLTGEIQKLTTKKQSVEIRIANSHLELKNQLSKDQITVLASVNGKLAGASPGREITGEEASKISDFCSMFERKSDVLNWFDVDIRVSEDNSLPLSEVLIDLKAELRDKESLLKQLESASANPDEKIRQIKSKTQELKKYDKDLEIIENFDGAEKNLKSLMSDLEKNETEKTSLRGLVEKHKTELERVGVEHEKARSLLATKKTEGSTFAELLGRLNRLGQIQPKLMATSEGEASSADLLSPDDLNDEGVLAIERQCHTMGELRDDILRGLCHFMDSKILSEEHQTLRDTRPSNEDIRNAWLDLQDVYANLEHRTGSLEDQRRTHNELVENYRTSLRKNRDFINNVQSQLNRSLEHVAINDLAEIKVEIECDEAFESLVRQSEQINPHTSKSLSDAFYDQLKTFMAKFFTDKEDGQSEYRLTMEKVIKKISYKTRKVSQKHFEDKAQSNSTTAMINLSLVQGLLKGLLDQGYDYTLPAVLDEVANVDVSQIASLLGRIRDDGFRLFGAATNSASNTLVFEIGRHFNLDDMRTARPYHESRNLVYWGGPEGTTKGSVDSFVYPEQRALMMDEEEWEEGSDVG